MSERREILATQEYVDYQLSLNQQSHDAVRERVNYLEQMVETMNEGMQRMQDDISRLQFRFQTEVGGLRNE